MVGGKQVRFYHTNGRVVKSVSYAEGVDTKSFRIVLTYKFEVLTILKREGA